MRLQLVFVDAVDGTKSLDVVDALTFVDEAVSADRIMMKGSGREAAHCAGFSPTKLPRLYA
jgi:hypothetical protein